MPDEQLETAANTHTPMQHPLSVVYDHQVPAHAGAEATPGKETSMSLRLRLFAPMRVTRSHSGEGEKPGASCAALLHASTEGTRTCACVSVLREGRGLECVFTHTHGIPPSPLDRCSVPLSITPLSLFSLRRSVNGPSLRRRSSRAAVHALTPGVEPTPGETGRQGQEGGGVHRC